MRESAAATPEELDADLDSGLDRIIGLNDGIYAFAMTLLAVNIDLPQIAASASSSEVTTAVLNLFPQLFIFVTSFLLVALYWQVSRRTFRIIKRNNTTFSWLVILQLMCVAFLPVATGLFDTHPQVPLVITVYAGTLLIIGVLGQVQWWYVQRAHLIDENITAEMIRYYGFRGLVTVLIYSLLLIAGLVIPNEARAVLLLLLVFPFLQRIYRRFFSLSAKGSPS